MAIRRMTNKEKIKALKEAIPLLDRELNAQLRQDTREAKDPKFQGDPSFIRKQNQEIRREWSVIVEVLHDRIRVLEE